MPLTSFHTRGEVIDNREELRQQSRGKQPSKRTCCKRRERSKKVAVDMQMSKASKKICPQQRGQHQRHQHHQKHGHPNRGESSSKVRAGLLDLINHVERVLNCRKSYRSTPPRRS